VAVSRRGGRKIKIVRKPGAGRQKGTAYPVRHWFSRRLTPPLG
jgi:hypothetical protein